MTDNDNKSKHNNNVHKDEQNPDLLPYMKFESCPFCGCEEGSLATTGIAGVDGRVWVECKNCKARGPVAKYVVQAIKKWKVRVGDNT